MEFCQIEGIGLGHSTEITCMLFIDPHPCLVTADADANICVWGVRPYYPKYHVLYRCRIPRTPTPIEEDVRLASILKEREERKSKLNDNKNNKGTKDNQGNIDNNDNTNEEDTFMTGMTTEDQKTEKDAETEEDTFAITTMTRVPWKLKDVLPLPKKDPHASDSEEDENGNVKHSIPQGDLSNLTHHEWQDKWKKENLAGAKKRTDEDVDIFMQEVNLIEQEEFPIDYQKVRKKKKKNENKNNDLKKDYVSEQDKNSILLMCTTDDGQMTIFDLFPCLPAAMIESPIKEELLPPQLNSFNPLRRVTREGDDKAVLEMKMREVFRIFDQDDSGDIDVDELEEALGAMGHNFTKEECTALIMEADDDNSGVVEFEEFVGLIALAQRKTKDREMEILKSMTENNQHKRRSVAFIRNQEGEENNVGEAKSGAQSGLEGNIEGGVEGDEEKSDANDERQEGKEQNSKSKNWTKEKNTGHQRGAPFVITLHSWKAHQSSITALRVINEPKRYLTTSTDGKVCLWNGNGLQEGILTRGSRKDEEIVRLGYTDDWNFPIDMKLWEEKEKSECIEIEKRIEKYHQERLDEEAEARVSFRRTSSLRLMRSGSASSAELSRMTSGLDCIQGSPQMKRKRLVGQLKGETTWTENGAEIGYKRMLEEERVTLLQARLLSKEERRKKAPDKEGRQLDDLLADGKIFIIAHCVWSFLNGCSFFLKKLFQTVKQKNINTNQNIFFSIFFSSLFFCVE